MAAAAVRFERLRAIQRLLVGLGLGAALQVLHDEVMHDAALSRAAAAMNTCSTSENGCWRRLRVSWMTAIVSLPVQIGTSALCDVDERTARLRDRVQRRLVLRQLVIGAERVEAIGTCIDEDDRQRAGEIRERVAQQAIGAAQVGLEREPAQPVVDLRRELGRQRHRVRIERCAAGHRNDRRLERCRRLRGGRQWRGRLHDDPRRRR